MDYRPILGRVHQNTATLPLLSPITRHQDDIKARSQPCHSCVANEANVCHRPPPGGPRTVYKTALLPAPRVDHCHICSRQKGLGRRCKSTQCSHLLSRLTYTWLKYTVSNPSMVQNQNVKTGYYCCVLQRIRAGLRYIPASHSPIGPTRSSIWLAQT